MSNSTTTPPARDTLIDLRFERGMTREDIAEHYGVSIATVRRWIKDLDVPRPRRKKQKRSPNLAPNGAIIGDYDGGYSRFEKARIKLGARLIDRPGYGYYLDGRPATIDAIYAAAETL
ncbi:transcriptional regulator [Ruegeria phage RpAliso]|nr:transcriptional regulator [Ruegeria phage RpAliso]